MGYVAGRCHAWAQAKSCCRRSGLAGGAVPCVLKASCSLPTHSPTNSCPLPAHRSLKLAVGCGKLAQPTNPTSQARPSPARPAPPTAA